LEEEMSVSCGRIAALVTKIQNEFLDKAGLALTLSQAQNWFGADEITCEAVLGALVDAKVLAKTPDGAYIRFFPRLASGPPVRIRPSGQPCRRALRRHIHAQVWQHDAIRRHGWVASRRGDAASTSRQDQASRALRRGCRLAR
jgi:hypothetical protein